jgi:hypothetical protein
MKQLARSDTKDFHSEKPRKTLFLVQNEAKNGETRPADGWTKIDLLEANQR